MKSYSVQEACQRISCKTTRFYQLVNSGSLKARKIGRKTVVLESDLDAFLNGLEPYQGKGQGA